MTVYLVRHCQAESQDAEAPLTKEGVKQSDRLAVFFADKKINAIYSSPFKRAIQSVEQVALDKKLPIIQDFRLQERRLSGKPIDDWKEKLAASFDDPLLTLDGGESSKEAAKRGWEALEESVEKREGAVMLVTHGNLLALLLRKIDERFGFAEWEQLSNPDVFKLTLSSGIATSVQRVWQADANKAPHLT
ncbi:histidine phosphatase family protein [Bacillaceae bacterium SIJ1]|nr:histidine phosphatase family protein [Litoribacterium kuwaitense]